jgi:hypothetical protein
MLRSSKERNLHAAIDNYCGGVQSAERDTIISQLDVYRAAFDDDADGDNIYTERVAAVKRLVKSRMLPFVAGLEPSVKGHKVRSPVVGGMLLVRVY